MGTALYRQSTNEINPDCPHRHVHGNQWADDLPSPLKDLVVPPICLDVFKEYELQADRTCGRDAAGQACYYASRLFQSELRSDDDEAYFEYPVYAEAHTSWRLLDERWLTCHTVVTNCEEAGFQTSFTVNETMPR
jgi:hypothetical protein